uniref:Uncharacterized protein n=1 Tax=Eutreptiella gymnastica TaxID=73025 RepID=A0A7S4G157_9EUGL
MHSACTVCALFTQLPPLTLFEPKQEHTMECAAGVMSAAEGWWVKPRPDATAALPSLCLFFLLGWEEIQAKVSWRTGTCKIKDQSVHCYDTAPRAYSQGNAAWMQVHLGPEACGLQLLEHVLR